MLPVLICIAFVSDPSVVKSAVGVIVNEPLPLVRANDPEVAAKSPVGLIVQYKVVLATFVVLTLIVPALPSLIEVGAVTL